ncbi:unnamed protein product, partial [Rotaria magnacalcarata]
KFNSRQKNLSTTVAQNSCKISSAVLFPIPNKCPIVLNSDSDPWQYNEQQILSSTGIGNRNYVSLFRNKGSTC